MIEVSISPLNETQQQVVEKPKQEVLTVTAALNHILVLSGLV